MDDTNHDGSWQHDPSISEALSRRVDWRYDGRKLSYEYRIEGRKERFWHSLKDFLTHRESTHEYLTPRIKKYLAEQEGK